MDRYEFKVRGPKEKCVKLFLSSEEVKTLCMESLLDRILTRFTGLRGKEVSLKYADNNDWIELPADDLDSFIDMIETAKDSARENLKVIELARNQCVRIATIRGTTKLCVRLHPVLLLRYVKR